MNKAEVQEHHDNSSFRQIIHDPTGACYTIEEFTRIKCENGDWLDGVIYTDTFDNVYSRPITMFDNFSQKPE